jgi:hypothetical protein
MQNQSSQARVNLIHEISELSVLISKLNVQIESPDLNRVHPPYLNLCFTPSSVYNRNLAKILIPIFNMYLMDFLMASLKSKQKELAAY